MPLAICYVLLAIYLLVAICYLLSDICYLLVAICLLLVDIRYFLSSCYLLFASCERSKHQRLNGSRNPGHERVRVALWLWARWPRGRKAAIAQGLESRIQSCLNRPTVTAHPIGADPPSGAASLGLGAPRSSSQLHSHNYVSVIVVCSLVFPIIRSCDFPVCASMR